MRKLELGPSKVEVKSTWILTVQNLKPLPLPPPPPRQRPLHAHASHA